MTLSSNKSDLQPAWELWVKTMYFTREVTTVTTREIVGNYLGI